MRILIGGIAHETNTFSNVKTTVESFKQWEWIHGDTIIQKHRKVRNYLGGMIDRAEEIGVEIIPSFSAFAMPSGLITKETYERLIYELTDSIKAAGEFEAVCLALHGAGVAEDADDLEGGILSAVREIIGYKIPVVVTLDLHGNITDQMVKEADVLLGVNFYPHVDCYERGKEAIDITKQILLEEIHPKMSLKKLPLMIPTSTTNLPPAKHINELCWTREKNEKIIDCTFFHGFPYTNIPEVGVTVVAITNNDQELADQTAEEIAIEIWNTREDFFPDIDTPEEGINKALRMEGKPIIINETSDNPGGGTPGDGTHLLSAMLKAKLENACFGFIYDPEVVDIAHESGVGTVIEVLLGGKTDDMHGEPIHVKAYVKTLTDGQFIQSSPMGRGASINYGKSARVIVDGIDIIICSKRSQTLDEQIFLLHGIDIKSYKIVALKSSQHFRAGFEPLAKEIISVDSPGLSSFNLKSFNHTRLRKKVYPFYKEITLFQKEKFK
ncbi:MlrC domain protein [Cytobacillus firmus]|uniref:M81 family metallopeptidase n=1 Tax=Cytobacillus firmus TaxID=1399 RepID=UPI00077C1B81|nr:M81 family metallopeptidase [Cytobacillus firmus]MBG9541732.1 MlrC domain protein [Cytobacillus firmus]MBG9551156.1 MlrC domain protein [Cytobacillus firmus]MBG9558818.1 MlrC domain protein [Cytobacillus firmus]MBG9575509.1 MlrC domain protein [Cytobacillus firmus]MEC1892891.1 M81 family metallopeptidase [Cytobacillus firmus]